MLNALELYRKYGQQDRAESVQDQQMANQQQQREFANNMSMVQMAQQQQARQQAMQQAAQQREQAVAMQRNQLGMNAQLQREKMSQAERMFKDRLQQQRDIAASRGVQGQKAPTGYRWTESGDLEKIPGGPKDDTDKMQMNADIAKQKAGIVTQKVDQALKQTGFFSTGLTGTILGAIPGTGAYDLDKTLDTIKANIGFNELQQMRMASPTGGALGQVAVQELNMLQSVLSSLDKGQSEEQLKDGLGRVKMHYDNWKNTVEKAATEGKQGAGTQPTQQNQQRQVVRTGKEKGTNRKVIQYSDGSVEYGN
jgi:hypothetical protein